MAGPQAVLVTKAAATFTWACPACFSKALAKHAVRVQQPGGARVAGSKRKRAPKKK